MTTPARAPQFSEENLKKLEELKKRYPTTKALVLPVLWLAQEQFGWISGETLRYIAGLLNVPVSHLYGVLTFYTMYNAKPVGKYHLQVCTNVSCMLRGGEALRDRICQTLNIGIGETTPDGRFTVSEVECLGSCGTAPMLQANDRYYENLNPADVDRLLEEMR